MLRTSMYQDMKYELPDLNQKIRAVFQNKTKNGGTSSYQKLGLVNGLQTQQGQQSDITPNTPIENILYILANQMNQLTELTMQPEGLRDDNLIKQKYQHLVKLHQKAKEFGKLKPEHNLGVLLNQYPELKTYIMKNVSLLDNDNTRTSQLFKDMPEELQKIKLDMYPSKQFLSNQEEQELYNYLLSQFRGADGSKVTISDLDKIKKNAYELVSQKYSLSKLEEKILKEDIDKVVQTLGYGRISAVPTINEIGSLVDKKNNEIKNALVNETKEIKDLQRKIQNEQVINNTNIENLIQQKTLDLAENSKRLQTETNQELRGLLRENDKNLKSSIEELKKDQKNYSNMVRNDMETLTKELYDIEERIKDETRTTSERVNIKRMQELEHLKNQIIKLQKDSISAINDNKQIALEETQKLQFLMGKYAEAERENNKRNADELKIAIREQKSLLDDIYKEEKAIMHTTKENQKEIKNEMANLMAKIQIESADAISEIRVKFDELNKTTLTGNPKNDDDLKENYFKEMDKLWKTYVKEVKTRLSKLGENTQGKKLYEKYLENEDMYSNEVQYNILRGIEDASLKKLNKKELEELKQILGDVADIEIEQSQYPSQPAQSQYPSQPAQSQYPSQPAQSQQRKRDKRLLK